MKHLKETTHNKKKSKLNRKTRKHSIDKNVFNAENYKSGDGMLTSVWGPSLWHSLHTMSFNYPIKPTSLQKKYYKRFLEALKYTLPCRHCRENFKANLKKYPINSKVLQNRYHFSLYVYQLHEHINTLLNKKSGLSYEDVRERYEHFRARCTKRKTRKTKKVKKHKGCIVPLHKFKSKGVVKIVPDETKCESFEIDEKCHILNKE